MWRKGYKTIYKIRRKWYLPELICSISRAIFVEVDSFIFFADVSLWVVDLGVIFNSFSSVCKFSVSRIGMIVERYDNTGNFIISWYSLVDETLKFSPRNGKSDPMDLSSAFSSSAKIHIIWYYEIMIRILVFPEVNLTKMRFLKFFGVFIGEI